MYDDRMTLTKLTVNLTPKAAAALDNAASITGDSKTDTVNRALQFYEWLEMEKATGRQILCRDPSTGDVEVIKWM
jgi:hypothetical protein